MIVLRDICRVYTIGDEQVHALDHASLQVSPGEFVSIIGPSGSGKSTLMNVIGCLDVATSGTYLLDGIPIEDYSENDLARIRNRKIGFVFQNFNLIAKLTAEENVELPLIYQNLPRAERKKRVQEALERVHLTNRSQHYPTELSGGQQQRVAIARAIATRPSLILADEPTGNLDSKTSAEIMDIFHELHEQGNTIVLITHDDEVAKQAARTVHILDGRVSDHLCDESADAEPSSVEAISEDSQADNAEECSADSAETAACEPEEQSAGMSDNNDTELTAEEATEE